MKNIFIRGSLIWALKNIVYLLISTTGLIFIGAKISTAAFSMLSLTLYAFLGFGAAEWTFRKGENVRLFYLLLFVIIMFLIDFLLTSLFYSWVYQSNIFARQTFWATLASLGVHALVTLGAYELRRREAAAQGLSEGLES
jgi:hypothetical protein